MTQLRIHEIFYSLQGESTRVGLPTVFVRLTGCPMRCVYCDTAYAFNGGSKMALQAVLDKVKQYDTPYVTVTGGEPLAQKECHDLLNLLCDEGFDVSLETGGALSIETVDPRVSVILDVKTPDSGELKNYLWSNIAHLKSADEVKFVLAGKADYEWSKEIMAKYALSDKATVLMSPVFEKLAPKDLADWIVADQLAVRMQLQMHKLLWGETPGK